MPCNALEIYLSFFPRQFSEWEVLRHHLSRLLSSGLRSTKVKITSKVLLANVNSILQVVGSSQCNLFSSICSGRQYPENEGHFSSGILNRQRKKRWESSKSSATLSRGNWKLRCLPLPLIYFLSVVQVIQNQFPPS